MSSRLKDMTIDEYIELAKSNPNLLDELHEEHREYYEHEEEEDEENNNFDYPSSSSSRNSFTGSECSPSFSLNISSKNSPAKSLPSSRNSPAKSDSDKPTKIITKPKKIINMHDIRRKMESNEIRERILSETLEIFKRDGGKITEIEELVTKDIRRSLMAEARESEIDPDKRYLYI